MGKEVFIIKRKDWGLKVDKATIWMLKTVFRVLILLCQHLWGAILIMDTLAIILKVGYFSMLSKFMI